MGRPQPSRRWSPRATFEAARNRQESSEQAGRGLGAGGSYEACAEGGVAARRRGGRAGELLNKRNVKGKKHARNKRKLPAWSGSVKQLLAKASGRRVKGRPGRAVEGLVCLVTAAGLDPCV